MDELYGHYSFEKKERDTLEDMGRTPRKPYRRKSAPSSSSERGITCQPKRPSRIEGGITCISDTSIDIERSPAIQATRYWLRNDTYVDLAVPNEKIGVPFDSAGRASALTDDEKAKVIVELSKCEPAIRAGNLHMLELALEICNRCQIAAPVWLLPHALEAINRLLSLHPRTRLNRMQREIHQIRWAAVHHLRASRGLTWDAAYEAARRELHHTRARGSEETIRASYKWMNLHPFIKSMRQYGLVAEIDVFAREQYEKRQAISERLISLESDAKPKRRPG
jgi:hypothetical protein